VLLAPAEAGKSSNHFGHVRRDAVPAHDILGGAVSWRPHDNLPPVEQCQGRKGLDFLGGFAMCIHVQTSL
jgi:hypothetical protein